MLLNKFRKFSSNNVRKAYETGGGGDLLHRKGKLAVRWKKILHFFENKQQALVIFCSWGKSLQRKLLFLALYLAFLAILLN